MMENKWQNNDPDQLKKFKSFLKRADVRNAIKRLPELTEEATKKYDCLSCANCCKNYSPRFKTPDIKRIARRLKLKESAFIDKYLRLDADGDYVTKSSPCPFLGVDNYCSIYDHRPSDCRRFPYSDEDVFIKRQNITLKNVTFCPIAFHVLDRLSEKMNC